MGRKKVIVTDLDDTLVKAYGKATEAVKRTWNEIIQRRMATVIIVTGQQIPKVKSIMDENGMELPDYIIANQGSDIFDVKNARSLMHSMLPNAEAVKILEVFFQLGGTEEFVRVCTGDTIIEYDCDVAREDLLKSALKNVTLVSDIAAVVRCQSYSKMILLNTFDVVNALVDFSLNNNQLSATNTGVSSYGRCGYHRFELTSSGKRNAVARLFELSEHISEHGSDILCLGDEQSDLGLAQFALHMNTQRHSSGRFAAIKKSNSFGNASLIFEAKKLAYSMGCMDYVSIEDTVENDGWVKAVESWIR